MKGLSTERSELGLISETLADVAKNPSFILRYNLIDAYRRYCVKVSPFSLDGEGYMVNLNGTRYSGLAKKYVDGELSREEIENQCIL